MSDKRGFEILQIIRQNPGASGVDIHTKLVARSWVGRRFGADSLIAALFGPSFGGMWIHLANLEQRGAIIGHFVDGPYPRRRAYWTALHGPDNKKV